MRSKDHAELEVENSMKITSSILIFGLLLLLSLKANSEEIDPVYHEMALALMTEALSQDDLVADIHNHPPNKVHNLLTASISQSFYIYVNQKNLLKSEKVIKSYKIVIAKMISIVGRDQVAQIIRRGYDLDGENNGEFRYGIHFFRDHPPESAELEKMLGSYLKL